MLNEYGLYIAGVLALLGGIELLRFSYPEIHTERGWSADPYEQEMLELQPGHLGLTVGFVLVGFAALSFYGGYSGWSVTDVLSVSADYLL